MVSPDGSDLLSVLALALTRCGRTGWLHHMLMLSARKQFAALLRGAPPIPDIVKRRFVRMPPGALPGNAPNSDKAACLQNSRS